MLRVGLGGPLAVCSRKSIYVRFDLNDYSIAPQVIGRPLTLVGADSVLCILDSAVEVSGHHCSCDCGQPVLEPAHQDAVLKLERKVFHSTPTGRLEPAVPETRAGSSCMMPT